MHCKKSAYCTELESNTWHLMDEDNYKEFNVSDSDQMSLQSKEARGDDYIPGRVKEIPCGVFADFSGPGQSLKYGDQPSNG